MKNWSRCLPLLTLIAGLAAGLVAPIEQAVAQGLNAVYSRNGTDVLAVGNTGVVYRSFNGGQTWTNRTLGNKHLRDVVARNLTIWVAGDSGKVYSSVNSGGAWSLFVAPGAPDLRALAFPSDNIGYVVGALGSIYKTTDGGATWSPQTSGTANRLNAVRFRDDLTGYAAGAAGTLLKTTDGGATWVTLSTGVSGDLRSVDYFGSTVWAVGNDGLALRSTDDGVSLDAVKLKITNRADVDCVILDDALTVTLTGGGGFMRRSTNGGDTWSWFTHPMMGEICDLASAGGGKLFACSNKNLAVLRSTNNGTTWSLPTGATTSSAWTLKQALAAGSVRGSTLAQHGTHKNTIYCVLGARLYKSENRGDTWVQISTITTVPEGTPSKTNAFYVSPSDSNLMVAAVGTVDRIVRSTNGGATWTTTMTSSFTEYGVPLEMDINNPDHMIFGPEDQKLYVSNDFGATFALLSNQPTFRSPCDIQIVADSADVIWVGDGITGSGNGQMWHSTNGGLTFTNKFIVSGSEIPMISNSPLQGAVGISTAWGSGGIRVTKDHGTTWTQGPTTGSAWGTDFAKDDPNAAVYGVYSGGNSYITLDQCATFTTAALPGANYSYYVADRGLFLAEQSGGVYKLNTTYTVTPNNVQSLVVASPNGGENWAAGSSHSITWSGLNVALATIEYRKAVGEPWQPIGTVDGYASTFNWVVPNDATTTAKIRIRDAWDSAPVDSSNAAFTIALPLQAATPADTLQFGSHAKGSSTLGVLTVSNPGTATTNMNLAVAGPVFTLNRLNLTLAAGASDTVGIVFKPTAATSYADVVTLTGNAFNAPTAVQLAGAGLDTLLLALVSPDGGQSWQYNSVHDLDWQSALINMVRLDYQTSAGGPWLPIADSLAALSAPFAWTIPNAPTAHARVRVSDVAGALADSSSAEFAIIVPAYASTPADTLDMGVVEVNLTLADTLTICNPGTAPLTISAVTSDNPHFQTVRTTLTIPAGGCDTVTVLFSPIAVGAESGQLTFVSDDPSAPHHLVVKGLAAAQGGVAGDMPRVFMLSQNLPNPFFGATQIRYALPQRAMVTLDVYDLQGRKITSLVHGEQDAGNYAVGFSANDPKTGNLPSGVYFYRFQAGSFARTYKMLLTR